MGEELWWLAERARPDTGIVAGGTACPHTGTEFATISYTGLMNLLESSPNVMGDQDINALHSHSKSTFLRHLLDDIDALERMIEEGLIESGITRIGAEQEICLVDRMLRPAMNGPRILEEMNDPHFTNELARWNLEINLDPCAVQAGCLTQMHSQLTDKLDQLRKVAEGLDNQVVLAGILPTIRKSELDFRYMTPIPRYKILDRMLKQLRGEDFSLYIEGVDEINLRHDSILFEACNTSFQVHLQIDPEDFADMYNWAQVLAGPVLSVAVNSPLLFGRELWSETRIALFRQSIETRHAGNDMLDRQPRVAFGNAWLESSAVEVFKNDVTHYKLIIGAEIEEESSLTQLEKGMIPRLRAMNLHNGTLYKWNRACYGVKGNRPHLRIENRYLPSGPTAIDEMANAAFWIGLMLGIPDKFRGRWKEHFHFQEVRSNFLKAARNGLSNKFFWFGEFVDARDLILDKLLPIAEKGFWDAGLEYSEFGKYLSVIEKRAARRRTGAAWLIESLRSLRARNTLDESILRITQILADRCLQGAPVHDWPIPDNRIQIKVPGMHDRVDSIMVTQLVTVVEDDPLVFAEKLMEWNHFHHLPVENEQGEIAGIISSTDLQSFRDSDDFDPSAQVRHCMSRSIVTVQPETEVDQARELMDKYQFRSLPVVRDRKIIGIITANDIARIQSQN